MNRQAVLPVALADHADFDNFLPAGNSHVVEFLRTMLRENISRRVAFIWGENGLGKTHLLYSACKIIGNSHYLSLKDRSLQPEILDELHYFAVNCIDDLDQVAGQVAWEKKIMTLFENSLATGNSLIFTANAPPQSLGFQLPDLKSRLYAREIFKLKPVSDIDKIRILTERASRRGIHIDDSVAQFALSRYARDMHSLLGLLDKIDRMSLQQQRRVTIPFLKQLEGID